ncbi:MAG: trypsin-like peptidase domain-containing protein [Pseudomonadales bacterium]
MRELIRYVLVPALVGGLVGLAVMYFNGDSGSTGDRPGYAAAVKRAAPAVVNIYSTKVVTPPICQLPQFRQWCDRISGPDDHIQSSLGSGVIVREDGYVLTNNHVIAGADEILVAFSNGEATTAQVVGSDPETDLAVIRVNASGLTAIPIGEPEGVQVGDVALAIGNPFGIGQTVSLGIVSATGRTGISNSPYNDFIQTDAAINPGNSGGALIDADGFFIGLNTLIFSRSGGSEGIGFAIPARLALSVLDEIVETGRVTRGWLGVVLAATPPPGAGVGLEVISVEAGGPAAQAGVQPGDLIVAVDGQPAVSSTGVSRQIAHAEPGTEIGIDLLRGGQSVTLTARSGERPSSGL